MGSSQIALNKEASLQAFNVCLFFFTPTNFILNVHFIPKSFCYLPWIIYCFSVSLQERDYLQDTDKLKEEIEKKEKYVKNLKCDVEKLQQTTDQLLSELDAKKKDLADAKIEQQLQLEWVAIFFFAHSMV